MAWFTGSVSKTLTIAAPRDKVHAFFSDPEQIRLCMDQLVRHEKLTPTRYRWVLQEKVDKGIRFQPDYVVEYQPGPEEVRWAPHGQHNMKSSGSVRTRALSETQTEVSYTETIEADIPVPRLLAKVIGGIVGTEISRGIEGYLRGVKKHLERG